MSIFKMFDKKTNQTGTVKTSAEQLRDIIWAHKGQYFSVTFEKADSTVRTIHGQVGYKKGHDGENTVAHIPKYITVIEKTAQGYQHRNVNTEKIIKLSVGGHKYVRGR